MQYLTYPNEDIQSEKRYVDQRVQAYQRFSEIVPFLLAFQLQMQRIRCVDNKRDLRDREQIFKMYERGYRR